MHISTTQVLRLVMTFNIHVCKHFTLGSEIKLFSSLDRTKYVVMFMTLEKKPTYRVLECCIKGVEYSVNVTYVV